MRRIIWGVAVAPKTTGDIGYTALDVQRHFTFNASPPLTGCPECCGNISTVTQFNFTLYLSAPHRSEIGSTVR